MNELPRLRLREAKSNVDLRVVIARMCQEIELPFYLEWGEVEFSDVLGKRVDSYDWVARGATSAAAIRTGFNSVRHPIIKVSMQAVRRTPSFKPWVYFEYFREFPGSKDDTRADYSSEDCWYIGRGINDDEYAYPACTKEMIFGKYQAQISGYFMNDRCLRSKNDFILPAGQYQSFKELTHLAEVSAARTLSATR